MNAKPSPLHAVLLLDIVGFTRPAAVAPAVGPQFLIKTPHLRFASVNDITIIIPLSTAQNWRP